MEVEEQLAPGLGEGEVAELVQEFGMGRHRSEDHAGLGPKVPQKQKKRARLWLKDGSRVRLRPERPDHV